MLRAPSSEAPHSAQSRVGSGANRNSSGPGGWLLDRELWLARHNRTANQLAAEFPGVPVLTFAEVPLLAGKPKELLHTILDVKAKFPDAGWIQ